MTNQHGEILIEPLPFQNSKSGFDLLLNSILPSKQESQNIIIVFESTVHYADNFIHFLISNHLIFKVINPFVTSSLHNANIHKIKTDSINARLICSILSRKALTNNFHRNKNFSEIYPPYAVLVEI